MKTAALLATLALSLALLAPAHAQDATKGVFRQRLDTNGDGIISRDEILAARQRLFSRLDRNGDGVIDQAEIEAARDAVMDRAEAMQARMGNAMRRMDTNGDGKVSAEEFRVGTPLFALADRNGDGKLSPDEIAFIRNLLGRHHG